MRISLESPVRTFPRIGHTTELLLNKLGLHTAQDILRWYPSQYEDFRNITTIGSIKENTTVCIKGKLTLLKNRRIPRRRMALTEGLLSDATGSLGVIWFNQGYLAKSLTEGETMLFAGKVSISKYGMQLVNPVFEKISTEPLHVGRLVPIYPTTKNVTQKLLRALTKAVLPLARFVKDPLPASLRSSYRLMPLAKAIEVIHFPVTPAHAEQAKQRIAIQEVVDIMLQLAKTRATQRKKRAYAHPRAQQSQQDDIRALPFSLTSAQKETLDEIMHDISLPNPMNRLIDGDVGSGKTVLAHLAARAIVNDGSQAALLAPTDILATQHATSLQSLFPTRQNAALFTRTKQFLIADRQQIPLSKKDLLNKISSGEIGYCIGTHALIQKNVTWKRLGLVIVDEQHRFGVFQRATSLLAHEIASGFMPHFLSLSATPIPRSLARIFFGGADISLLAEKPKGRLPIATRVLIGNERKIAYKKIADEISRGRQAFVICPIIEESDILGVRAATQEYERLKKEVFPNVPIGLVHGKLAQARRDETMRAFAENSISLLVATAVVEVGVDVPNATVMLIEGAQRFGLAQLHQFRGRIGRSDQASWCFAAVDDLKDAKDRLKAFAEISDGFTLAQKDLELRGPGTLFGVLQSGFPQLRAANLSDARLLKTAQHIARQLVEKRS